MHHRLELLRKRLQSKRKKAVIDRPRQNLSLTLRLTWMSQLPKKHCRILSFLRIRSTTIESDGFRPKCWPKGPWRVSSLVRARVEWRELSQVWSNRWLRSKRSWKKITIINKRITESTWTAIRVMDLKLWVIDSRSWKPYLQTKSRKISLI